MANGGNNHSGTVGGIYDTEGQTLLPHEFITGGKTFDEALGKCIFRDEAQKNAVIMWKAKLEEFHNEAGIQMIIDLLNGSRGVGGINNSLASMAHTMIYLPEGAGIKVGKNAEKINLERLREQRDLSRRKQENEDD